MFEEYKPKLYELQCDGAMKIVEETVIGIKGHMQLAKIISTV